MVLTTYGRSSGFCVDPIEKKPLSHFLPGTPVLSFGTAGCNLTCTFCQNWDISKARDWTRSGRGVACDDLAAAITGSRVAFTYNDPVIFLEYAIDVARRAASEASRPSRSPPATSARSRALSSFSNGRRQHRPEGLHRGFY